MRGPGVRAGGAATLGLILGLAGHGFAQEDHDQVLEVPLVEEMPVADGRLDEEVWALAAVADGFLQTEPVEGAEPTFATEVLVAYTPDALLVAARLEDDDPDAVVARQYRRDADLESDDNFLLFLDTYHDHRSAFYFITNAVGTRQDGSFRTRARCSTTSGTASGRWGPAVPPAAGSPKW